MFSIKSLVRTVQDWRRKRRGPKPSKRADMALECLDHRQLLSVNFTGNAAIDIPATTQPGTVILANNADPNTRHSQIPADLQSLIKVSGLDINGVRLKYTPNDDILSIAIEQPDNQKTGQPVLAGDTDNNGDGGTVDPAVKALRPSFLDFPYIGGSETMGVFLDFHDNNIPDVVAGIPNTPGAGKLYQVDKAVVNPDPTIANRVAPTFGDKLLTNTGASFLTNDPAQPGLRVPDHQLLAALPGRDRHGADDDLDDRRRRVRQLAGRRRHLRDVLPRAAGRLRRRAAARRRSARRPRRRRPWSRRS